MKIVANQVALRIACNISLQGYCRYVLHVYLSENEVEGSELENV